MLSGTAALAILFALITDALISARLARVLGANIPRRPARPIVCGLGSASAWRIGQLHDLGVPMVAAELGDQPLPPADRRLGVRCWSATSACETLQAVHVEPTRSTVVVPPATSSTWRRPSTCRPSTPRSGCAAAVRPDLAARVERAFGIHISRSPSALAAPAFAAAAAGEHVLATIAVGAEVLAVARLQVEPGCQAEGRTVAELEAAAGSGSCCWTGARAELAPGRRDPGRRRRAGRGHLPRRAGPCPLDRDQRPRRPPPQTVIGDRDTPAPADHRLWDSIAGLDQILAHPFLAGLADGSLDQKAFRFYVVQDASTCATTPGR